METTTNTGMDAQQVWAEAAAASVAVETERKQAGKPPRSFTEKMPCKLTAKELIERGKQIAVAHDEIDGLENARKNSNDGFKAQIELVEGRVRELVGTLRTETETRDVELVEEFIFATNTVRVSRADTKEVIRERAMTRGERQVDLPLETMPIIEELEAEEDADPTDVVDPQDILDGALPDENAEVTPKAKSRRRRSS